MQLIFLYQKWKRYVIWTIVIMSMFSICLWSLLKKESYVIPELVEEEIVLVEAPSIEAIEEALMMIRIDVKGAVVKPGVYELTDGMRVWDAIMAAGGLSKGASTKNINLSKKLTDQMMIVIATEKELEKQEESKEKEENVVTVPIEGIIEEENATGETVINTKVSLNQGTLEELMTLPGIGESKAKEIITYRQNSKFMTIEDVMLVKGIGASVFEKIKDHIIL